jgi:hypothetical protein
MEYYLLALRSLTYAQRAQELLDKGNIQSRLLKTPSGVSPKGCSHSLRVMPESAKAAASYLRGEGIRIEKVFATTEGRHFVEVNL